MLVSTQAIAIAIACIVSAIAHLALNEADRKQRETRVADVQGLYSSLIGPVIVICQERMSEPGFSSDRDFIIERYRPGYGPCRLLTRSQARCRLWIRKLEPDTSVCT
jgi:hypothetical protein